MSIKHAMLYGYNLYSWFLLIPVFGKGASKFKCTTVTLQNGDGVPSKKIPPLWDGFYYIFCPLQEAKRLALTSPITCPY